MPEIHVVLPVHGRAALTRCALRALTSTLRQPARLWVVANDDPLLRGLYIDPWYASFVNARKLDAVLGGLPTDATWLVTMHNDSAPLAVGWFDWLVEAIGDGVMGGFHPLRDTGLPHPLGAVYRVAWLRDTHASFHFPPFGDVGTGLPVPPRPAVIAPRVARVPWWLRDTYVAGDETGRMLWAHLGGGTIGPTKRRLPHWVRRQLWPSLVQHHLDRQGVAP